MKRLISLFALLALLLCACEMPAPALPTETEAAASGELCVHFIDVGQADCALLSCDGEYLLIDGGNKADSSLVVTYLEEQGVSELAAVVCTHAHEDHVGGLPAVLAVYPTAAVYAPTNTYSSAVFDDFLYYTDQQGLSVTIPAAGDSFTLGDATLTVLGPTKSYAETNDTSLVLRVCYGNTTFLFTGDMETDAENDMLEYWDGFDFHADVLKVGHHGSNTSTGYRFLNAVMPEYGIISVGAGNSYGHPHEEPLSRLTQAGVTILRTDTLGTIVAVSDGQTVEFTWEDQNHAPENATYADGCFIGNRNSHKFHLETCKNLPKEENRIYFDSYSQAIEAGYTPCGACLG